MTGMTENHRTITIIKLSQLVIVHIVLDCSMLQEEIEELNCGERGAFWAILAGLCGNLYVCLCSILVCAHPTRYKHFNL